MTSVFLLFSCVFLVFPGLLYRFASLPPLPTHLILFCLFVLLAQFESPYIGYAVHKCGIGAPMDSGPGGLQNGHVLPSTPTVTLSGPSADLIFTSANFYLQFHLFNRLGFSRVPYMNQDAFDCKIQKSKSSSLR